MLRWLGLGRPALDHGRPALPQHSRWRRQRHPGRSLRRHGLWPKAGGSPAVPPGKRWRHVAVALLRLRQSGRRRQHPGWWLLERHRRRSEAATGIPPGQCQGRRWRHQLGLRVSTVTVPIAVKSLAQVICVVCWRRPVVRVPRGGHHSVPGSRRRASKGWTSSIPCWTLWPCKTVHPTITAPPPCWHDAPLTEFGLDPAVQPHAGGQQRSRTRRLLRRRR